MRKLGFLVLVLGGARAFGWGGEGHNLVARLAQARLTPAAAAKVKEILGPDATIVSISSWADQVRNSRRESGPWHYIDIPIDKKHLDMARDCKNGDCVIAKIEDFKKVLVDPAATPVQRREALMFIVHFIGDMHQPLHCSDNKDKGGNDVRLDFNGRNMNLHSVWDSAMLSRMGTEDELYAKLSQDLNPGRTKKLGKGKVRDWAEQSHSISVKIVYGKLPKGTGIKITSDYEKAADPVIVEQLERAGARLAATLNAVLK